MKINRIVPIMSMLAIIIMMMYPAAPAPALGSKDNKQQTVQITGQVRLVGGAPLSNLVITNENREWYISREEQQKLWQYQQQIITVKGTEYYQDVTFANGKPAGRQYFLKNIKIMKQP